MAPSLPTVAVDLRALVPTATGIGVYTQSLLAALARRGSARYVGLAHAPLADPGEIERLGIGVEVERTSLGVVWQQLRLPRRLRRGDVDVLWSPLHTLPWRTPVPAVITVHDLTVWLYPKAHTLKVRLSQRPFFAHSLEQARAVVCVSQATARDLELLFPGHRAKTVVVPEGVDRFFHPAAEHEMIAIRAAFGCPEGYLLYVGTLEPRKNLDRLLDAWLALRERDPGTLPLLLAGSTGWHSEALRRRIESLAPLGVRHLGRLPQLELLRAFQGATAFVYPSLYEGFGLPPLEAMACGVPVITSSTSSLPEVVGDAGLLVDPTDVDGWSAAIRRLLDSPDLASELREKGLHRAATLTWERAAEAMEPILLGPT
ncbi:MAG: glycosyltransferase family 4 protein [Acidobacteria bacterium]|nr:glycosyltransferase family 4 protein [Acidobacteriota bacterium]